ncbi:hypothetical protein RND71_004570 [Anisodus tanguticus]|uniref:Uncharacterized protein n=1 Tax=Anisodus tanguticus TaxID=243964 RepID=A0AAE1SQS9_9SOLA|nr:hypothetical protein RND71_004570 [Anisodus tanguticus]
MGDGPRGIEVFEDHFQASTSGEDSVQTQLHLNNRSISRSWTRRKLKDAASMLNLFSPSKLPWMSGTDGQEKVSQAFSSFVFFNFLPKCFQSFAAVCILYPLDLSPQDSTLLSDVVEVGTLPCLVRDNQEKQYCFYISTRYGLKYECSSISKIKFKFPNWSSVEVEHFRMGPDVNFVSIHQVPVGYYWKYYKITLVIRFLCAQVISKQLDWIIMLTYDRIS